MGFFPSQLKQQQKRSPKGLRSAPVTKQNAQTLNRLGCSACPLANADVQTPKMQPTLAKETLVYFLAEAPGQHEDETSGKPLTGPSGKLLRECIPEGDEEYCSFDNVVRDRPPQNRTPVWTEIEHCRSHIVASIEKAKPKLIVGLGVVPLTWMLNSSDMIGMRGRLFAVKVGNHSCWFMPTYDPSFILRIAWDKKKPLNSRLGHCFRMDVAKAFKRVGDLVPPHVDTEAEIREGIQTFSAPDQFPKLLSLLKRARAAPLKAIDLETSALRPYGAQARILTVALSFEAVNFSFALDHPKSRWRPDQRKELLEWIVGIVTDTATKVAHNAPFELEWLIQYFGKGIVNHQDWECTMMQAHFIDERRGRQYREGEDSDRATYQKLDFLCKQHFGVAYKSYFKLNKKDMASADLEETLVYNAADTKYTLRLFHHQMKLLRAEGLASAYYEALPRQPTVAIMQHLGVEVDQTEIKRAQAQLKTEIEQIRDEIYELKVVKAFIADRKEFNPLSGPDTIAIFKDYLHRTELVVQDKETKKERYSTDKNVLDKIDHPLSNLIVRLRNRTKLKSTYIDCFEAGVGAMIWPGSRLHTSFNTTFAETGRLSSDDPNLQNFPQRNDAWVRGIVVAPKDHVLVAFDYGQLEGCTSAICSGDKVLIKALWEDYDIHMEWAQRTVAKYPEIVGGAKNMADKAVAKALRAKIKNKLVFPAIFGATSTSIAGYLSMPEPIIEDLMDDFWAEFNGLKTWQDRLMKRYYDDGYVESPTGRRHYYPLSRNQAINMPIQSFACDIVCSAMNELSYRAIAGERWHMHPHLNIHDDLSFIVPDDDEILSESIEEIYTVMLTPPYAYINVPLSVTCSIGKNWFKPEEIGKFWSHKDIKK